MRTTAMATLLGFLLLGQATLAFAEGKPVPKVIEVSGAATVEKIACSGGETVKISATSSTVTLTGSCGLVEVSGSTLQIDIESAKTLKITGASDQVNIKTVDVADVTGATNQVNLGSVLSIKVNGTANAISWESSPSKSKKPKISKKGITNTVTKTTT